MSTTPQIVQLIINDLGDDAGIVENYIWKLQQRITELEAQLPKWVSVEDEAPREMIDVVLVGRAEDAGIGSCLPARFIDGKFIVLDGFSNVVNGMEFKGATHWMPLPQPPKEQSHG